MKALNLLASTLLIVGGLNWGLVAIAEFDLVATLVGLDRGSAREGCRFSCCDSVRQMTLHLLHAP